MTIVSDYRNNGIVANGEKVLKVEHMINWMDLPQRVDPNGISLELGNIIEEVEDGFFTLFPTVNELIISNPDCNFVLSDETMNLFKKNNVLIRGKFDSNAEKLAQDLNLRFLHSDTELARNGDYETYGFNIVTLRFNSAGNAYLHQNISDPNGGGENIIDLPNDFYIIMNADEIADKCWTNLCCEDIKNNGILDNLINKARNKNGFLIMY